VLQEIRERVKINERVLVTTLTKRMAEDLTEYMHEQGVRVRYMHSDIETLERIEILRAPTAETGAQAIAGTINIITREGFQRRLNELRIGTGVENGRPTGGVFWSHNNSKDSLTYTLSAGLFANQRRNQSFSETQVRDAASGTLLEDRSSRTQTQGEGMGLNLNARLQWRLV